VTGDGRRPDDGSFEQRLSQARGKHGMDAVPPGKDGSTSSLGAGGNAFGVGVRVGVELLSAMVVALAIGWYLDRWLHTSPLFLVVFVLLGGAAGVANVWRTVGPKRPPV
jgi:ATP synthase protein I